MSESQWYYARDGEQSGPVSTAELKKLALAGQLRPEDLVWREGLADWSPAGKMKGLFQASGTLSGIDVVRAEPSTSLSSIRRRRRAASFEKSFSLVQLGLWSLCGLVAVIGLINVLIAMSGTKDAAKLTAAATLYLALFVGTYALARTADRIGALTEQLLSQEQREK